MTNTVTDVPKAVWHADETGLVTVQAQPSWWRKWGQDADWPEYAEMLAQVGEKARSDDVCGVLGRTTYRPCRHNTRLYGPCPHHCETPLRFHCATERKKGGWCRWDLRKGACGHHPDSYGKYMAAVRADEEELGRQAVREQELRKAAEKRHAVTLGVACPYCDAQPGGSCVRRNGEEQPKLHSARENLWLHTETASETACFYCEAAVGELCRTSSGKIAIRPHTGR
ncbi:zinc finger domain-containing protein [Streptomyces sp. NPDC002537]